MPLKPVIVAELNPPLSVTVIRDLAGFDQLHDFFTRIPVVNGVRTLGWDIETDPKKDFFWRRMRTCQFGNQYEQYVIDLRHIFESADNLFSQQGHYGLKRPSTPLLTKFIETVRPVVCSSDYLKVGVNLGFENLSFYWLLGLRTHGFFDCSVAERVIWAGAHSLKDYGFYSMEEMMQRYFLLQIDKSHQESFTIDADLTQDQYEYAALDTRFPLALMTAQRLILQGETVASLRNNPYANVLARIDPFVLGDDLQATAQLENNAIGAFQDMHIHGERLDRERWRARIVKRKQELARVIREELDPHFLPLVGNRNDNVTDEQIAAAKDNWKVFNVVTAEELTLKATWRTAQKNPDSGVLLAFESEHTNLCYSDDGTQKLDTKTGKHKRELKLETARRQRKEELKKVASALGKKQTRIRNLAADCEGDALINYNSGAQVLDVLQTMKGLKGLKDTDDDSLEAFASIPVIAGFRKYRTLSKEIKTYGESWTYEWKTKPCKDEGWLHPGDGRLHCVFNQYDAETGRTSSEQPNAQNLPRDKDVRACFIADPPDESVRVSVCCDADTEFVPLEHELGLYRCMTCGQQCDTKAEDYVIVTADMSGAELRILADLAQDPVWLGAFRRGEDVHAVCTELIEAEKWPTLALPGCAYFALHTPETVASNPFCTVGAAQKKKCKCPEHDELRNGMKPTNFGLPYGISERALAPQIGKSLDDTRKLMAKHKLAFPAIWTYIDNAGTMARIRKRAFDMFGRRRLFPDPTWERATDKAKEDREERLRYPQTLEEAVAKFFKTNQRNPSEAETAALKCVAREIERFVTAHGRKPTPDEKWDITHRQPNPREVGNALFALQGAIERQGKNHEIQGTNASIAKVAMGAGLCPAGKPYLYHTLPLYKAKLLKMVHDELVVQAPTRFAQTVADLIGDAFKRAAAERMTRVVMEFDYHIATYWKK